MKYEYVKETPVIKDKTDKQKNDELITNFIKTKKALDNARNNYNFAEENMIDFYLYEIKANQSKLDYLIKKAKKEGIQLDIVGSFILKNRNAI